MAKTFTITCYGETKEYPESQRKKMIKEFEIAMLCCDGSEAERYRNIYGDLIAGEKYSKVIFYNCRFLCCIPVSDTPNLLKQFHSQLFRESNLYLITKSQDFIYQFVSHKKCVIK